MVCGSVVWSACLITRPVTPSSTLDSDPDGNPAPSGPSSSTGPSGSSGPSAATGGPVMGATGATAATGTLGAVIPCDIDTPTLVTAGKAGIIASTPARAGYVHGWSFSVGVVAALAADSVAYTAPASGNQFSLTCRATRVADGAFVETSVEVTSVAPAPACALRAARQVTVGRAGIPAECRAASGVSAYEFSVAPATLTEHAATSPRVRYTAPAEPGELTLTARTFNEAGDATTETKTVTVVARGYSLFAGVIDDPGHLNSPRGLATLATPGGGADFRLFVAEHGAACVHVYAVNEDGGVTEESLNGLDCDPVGGQTLLGPQGLSARSNAAGETEVYIADDSHKIVRWTSAGGGSASVFVGSPVGVTGSTNGVGTAARLNDPTDVAVSADGMALFIAELSAHTVRQVDVATQQTTTFMGTANTERGGVPVTGAVSSRLLSSPRGLALTADSSALFLIEWSGWAHRIDRNTGIATPLVFVGGLPRHAAVDTTGRLITGKFQTNEVHSVSLGASTVVAGDGTNGVQSSATTPFGPIANPDGLAVDPWNGDLFVSSSTKHVILRVRY